MLLLVVLILLLLQTLMLQVRLLLRVLLVLTLLEVLGCPEVSTRHHDATLSTNKELSNRNCILVAIYLCVWCSAPPGILG